MKHLPYEIQWIPQQMGYRNHILSPQATRPTIEGTLIIIDASSLGLIPLLASRRLQFGRITEMSQFYHDFLSTGMT